MTSTNQQGIGGSVDEKSQIQALDRTQPGLPLKKGRCGTYTHNYIRHGTTTLFAALEILEGKVIGQCYPRHRHQEFIKFLRHVNAEFPEELNLHLIVDNYGTHKHPRVQSWLKRHPRFARLVSKVSIADLVSKISLLEKFSTKARKTRSFRNKETWDVYTKQAKVAKQDGLNDEIPKRYQVPWRRGESGKYVPV